MSQSSKFSLERCESYGRQNSCCWPLVELGMRSAWLLCEKYSLSSQILCQKDLLREKILWWIGDVQQ